MSVDLLKHSKALDGNIQVNFLDAQLADSFENQVLGSLAQFADLDRNEFRKIFTLS